MKNYSVAQLKRDAKAGILSGEMTARCGQAVEQDRLPERLRGLRKIVDANSVSLFFEIPGTDKVSALDLPKAACVEYTEDCLRTYYPGFREPSAEEQRVLDGWKAIASTPEFKQRAEYDALTDGSSTYYQELYFFQKYDMEYLMGGKEQKGMCLDYNQRNAGKKEIIRDANVRGALNMAYRLERVKTLDEVLAEANNDSKAFQVAGSKEQVAGVEKSNSKAI